MFSEEYIYSFMINKWLVKVYDCIVKRPRGKHCPRLALLKRQTAPPQALHYFLTEPFRKREVSALRFRTLYFDRTNITTSVRFLYIKV